MRLEPDGIVVIVDSGRGLLLLLVEADLIGGLVELLRMRTS